MLLEPSKQRYDTTAEQGLGRQPGCASTSSTASLSSPTSPSDSPLPPVPSSLNALPGEQLADDYQVFELPDSDGDTTTHTTPETSTNRPTVSGSKEMISAGLQLQIEALQAGNNKLKKRLATASKEGSEFGMDRIKHDDCLVAFYDQCRTPITN